VSESGRLSHGDGAKGGGRSPPPEGVRVDYALCQHPPWWHPLRVAEQAAMLDVISGGWLEFGIGCGYQPREAETWGWRYESTIQDQERQPHLTVEIPAQPLRATGVLP
jgi:Luciferase-like monooxygenase